MATTTAVGLDTSTRNYITESKGIKSWLLTVDHKRIAIMYLISVLSAFLIGGIAAVLIRTELAEPGMQLMTSDQYNQVFTLHGAVMVFMFIIPGIPAVFGNFALPIMIGAKDVAFPKINLLSWYFWLAGTLFAIASLLINSADTGWTFYTPYSTETETAVSTILFGAFLLGFSSIFTGLNFIVTIHKLRAPGMTWYQLPLFCWSLYATSVIQILATPVLGITLLLVMVERFMGVGIFNPALGGDPVLFQHFFWFYSHPAVYIMILPGMGVASEVISIFSRKHIFGYKFIAWSSVAIAILGFFVWGHHMFVSGQSKMAGLVFSAITFSVAIPSAIKVFNWISTMYKGNIHLEAPMLYGLAFIFLFTIGGLTGLFLSTLATDVHLHDTYFIVAHFHYVMVGSMMMAFFAAMHHWWPKMFGVMYNKKLAMWAWGLVFFGFNLTFFPQFIMGAKGMPRRYADYIDEFANYHRLSTAGSYILTVGIAMMAVYFYRSLKNGKRTSHNPWGGGSLEWRTSSPPPHFNFDEEPTPLDPYNFDDLVYSEEDEGYVGHRLAHESELH